MRVLYILICSLVAAVNAAKTGKNFSDSPCYAAFTAVISDSSQLRVRRIVTTGVRRFASASTDDSPVCTVADQLRADKLKRAVTVELGDDAPQAHWIVVATKDSSITGEHLLRMQQMLRNGPVATLVHVAPDSDLVVPRAPK